MTQELKKRIEETFQHVADVANHSSLGNLRDNISGAIEGAKNAAAEHIDDFQRANAKVDPFADRLLDKAKRSEYSLLYIAFFFVSGMGAGFGLHYLF